MKNKKGKINSITLLLSLFLITLILSLGSCNMFIDWFGTTIEDRVDSFNDDLSAGKLLQLYKHFHSDTKMRSDMQTENFWINSPLNYEGTYIVNYNVSGDTVTGTINNGSNLNFTMEMKKDGLEYYILTLDIGSSYEIRKLQ